jgi:hypothetical protein
VLDPPVLDPPVLDPPVLDPPALDPLVAVGAVDAPRAGAVVTEPAPASDVW